MHLVRRTPRDVLREKRGISASLPEALAGAGLKAIIIAAVGGVIATGFTFWAVSTASADTSSGFQNANVAFEKAVHEADVVIGTDDSRVGLLRDLPGGKCEVQTWQGMKRDGGVGLQVDVKTSDGVCTATTPLHEAGAAKDSKELLFHIDDPVFAYANLGGREITFNTEGVPTLTTGVKPDGTKKSNWEDVRPYKVTMTLQSLSDDTAAAARKSVSTGYTNVVAVTAAADDLRYVPSPSTDPIPGTVKITGVVRSNTHGTEHAGAREGAAVTFTGAICDARPTKVFVTYTQQSPVSAPPVTTIVNATLTGGATTVHLGSVPNGSTGEIEVAASCIDEGVVVKDGIGFTQAIPATKLTVKQNAAADERHDLSWVAVSSLPTSFEVRWSVGAKKDELLTTTGQFSYQAVNSAGANLGLTTTYTVVAVIDQNRSLPATGSITNPMAPATATTVTTSQTGASWSAISCPAYTSAQYSYRYHRQVGTSQTVNWTAMSAWSTGRVLSGVTTPAYGRTVVEVDTRCVATVTGAVSKTATSPQDAFYAPEAVGISAARSTTVGDTYTGTREGVLALYSGGRCYGNTPTTVHISWQPVTPSGQSTVSAPAVTKVRTTAVDQVNLAGVRNGASGSMVAKASCYQVRSSTVTTQSGYTQTLPSPVLTVKQGSSVDQHVLSWGAVSSLPTTFQVTKKAASGTANAKPAATQALTQTLSYTAGTNYGNKTDYAVSATVGAVTGTSSTQSITGAWPAVPKAGSITYTRTGGGNKYQGGVIKWNYAASCPAGTTLQGRALENRTGQANGTISNTVQHTTAWAANKASHDWWPAYSLQGYTYGVGVDTKCVSNVTGFQSGIASSQSANFTTPFAQPAAPKYNGFNFRDRVRGSLSGYFSTCWGIQPNKCNTTFTPIGKRAIDGGKWYESYRMDFITYCPAGSSMVESRYWTFNTLNGYFGKNDGWQFAEAQNSRVIEHKDPAYKCQTPFAKSGYSVVGADVIFTMKRLWW